MGCPAFYSLPQIPFGKASILFPSILLPRPEPLPRRARPRSSYSRVVCFPRYKVASEPCAQPSNGSLLWNIGGSLLRELTQCSLSVRGSAELVAPTHTYPFSVSRGLGDKGGRVLV